MTKAIASAKIRKAKSPSKKGVILKKHELDIPHLVSARNYPFQIELSYILNVYFDQKSDKTLSSLLEKYATYSPELLDRIEFIIIDDGSPKPITLPNVNLNITHARIDVNKPWNSAGAKNLGCVLASSDKVLITDLDYEFPEKTLQKMILMRSLKNRIYKCYIENSDGSYNRPHPNTFLLSRALFLKHHGYDEEFAGFYGFEDTLFYRAHRTYGNPILKLNKAYSKKERTVDRKKAYHSLVRDLERNRPIEKRKREEWLKYGPYGGHSRKMLRFPWTLVEDRERKPHKLPKTRKHWLGLWPARYLKGLLFPR